MKKIIIFLSCIFVFALHGRIAAAAEGESLYGDILESSGANGLDTSAADDFLRENGIDPENAESVIELDIQTVLSALYDEARERASAPLKLFAVSVGIIILMSLIRATCDAAGGTGDTQYRTVGVLVCTVAVSKTVGVCLGDACGAVEAGSEFLSGFAPVLATLAAASGSAATAGAYSAVVMCFSGFASSLVGEILMPLLAGCLALSIVDAVSPCVRLGPITSAAGKISCRLLGIIMVVFVGMLSIQSIVGSAADNLAARAGKYIVGGTVPIVGSTVSEAYSSVCAGLGVLKSTTGAFGIVSVAAIVVPPLLSAFLLYASFCLSSALAEAFDVRELAALFNNIRTVFSIALAALVCFLVMAVISTAAVMLSAGGG